MLALVRAARAHLGDRFGGFWIDREAGRPIPTVAVVNPTVEDVARLQTEAPGGKVRIVGCRYSERELERFMQTASAVIQRSPRATFLGLGPSPQIGAITVELNAPAPELVEELLGALPADAIVIEVSPGARIEPLRRPSAS